MLRRWREQAAIEWSLWSLWRRGYARPEWRWGWPCWGWQVTGKGLAALEEGGSMGVEWRKERQ